MKNDAENVAASIFDEGVGTSFDLSLPFLMVSQHPVTTEYGEGEHQIMETLLAVKDVGVPAAVFWPNADAGAEDIARGIRKFRENCDASGMHFFKNLPAESYIKLMTRTGCLIGNSSSAIREGAFIGTPAVSIGSRQHMRQRGKNVIDVDHNRSAIATAIRRQLTHGPYPSEPIYGDGRAGERIARILSTCQVNVQKRIAY
jgi:UDP-N-acetylglucosamine 2-epimerase